MPDTSKLRVRVFDGARQEMAGAKVLITITDGRNKQIVRDYYPSGTVFLVPFYNNNGDTYTVVAVRDGHKQAGFTPIVCNPQLLQTVDIMLLSDDAEYNFADAKWEALQSANLKVSQLLSAGVTAEVAKARYEDRLENQGPTLACFFNLTTAMAAIPLPQGTPLDYFKQLIWDETFAQDRFFAYADQELHNQVMLAAQQGEFAPEAAPGFFHPGATDSFKQIQFGEANVQLTFHADDAKIIDGVKCIRIEPDIDYYKDVLAHGLLEVLPNGLGHSLTNPMEVYVLRWIAGRHAGVPEFNPPYTLIA